MHFEGIFIAFGELVGTSEADEIGSHDAIATREYGDHFAIEKRPGRFAVQAQDDFPLTLVNIMHTQAVDLDIMRLVGETGQTGETLIWCANYGHTTLLYIKMVSVRATGGCPHRQNF